MADLGNLDDFLKESVSNLDWLEVDEKRYRELDTLPKQNLDIAPDLNYLWSQSTSPFVPNSGEAPRTMGDLSDAHGPLRKVPESLIRTARLLVMQTDDVVKIGSSLKSRFDSATLAHAKTALSGVLAERGLLGRLYVAASDFPDCHNRGGVDFVRRYALDAPFVLAKPECSGCRHKHADAYGIQHCAVFNKQLEIEVPYSAPLAEKVESSRLARGVHVASDISETPKERIRKAFLAQPDVEKKAFTGIDQQAPKPVQPINIEHGIIAVDRLLQKKKAAEQEMLQQVEARPVVALIRRELLKGRNEHELIKAMKLSFSKDMLNKTKQVWIPVFKEAGLFGSVYTTQDSFEDCREGSDFLSRHSSKVKAVVAGSKCDGCSLRQGSFCMVYGRKLVAKAEELYTPEVLSSVVVEHKTAGTLPYYAERVEWGTEVRDALRTVYRTASSNSETQSARAVIEQAFMGSTTTKKTSYLVRRELAKVASQFMNEGLYGDDLQEALQRRFSTAAILDAAEDLKVVLAEQGLQGIKYVDPTAYDDYGHGCKTAARTHRTRGSVKYAKMGDVCASCVHHTRPGYCSTLNKELVTEPPYVDKYAEQQAVLSSGRSTEVSFESLMNNGLTTLQEYQLQHQANDFDLNPVVSSGELVIDFANQKYKV